MSWWDKLANWWNPNDDDDEDNPGFILVFYLNKTKKNCLLRISFK